MILGKLLHHPYGDFSSEKISFVNDSLIASKNDSRIWCLSQEDSVSRPKFRESGRYPVNEGLSPI